MNRLQGWGEPGKAGAQALLAAPSLSLTGHLLRTTFLSCSAPPCAVLWKPRPRLTGPPPTGPALALPGESHSRGGLHGLGLRGHRVRGAGARRGRHPRPQPCAAPCLEWGGGTQAQGNPPPPPACFPTVQAQGPPPHCRQELGAGAGGGPRVRPGGRPVGRARQVWGGAVGKAAARRRAPGPASHGVPRESRWKGRCRPGPPGTARL